MGEYYVSMNASCADDQNLKIVRCPVDQGRWYHDFWTDTKHPLFFYVFQEEYIAIIFLVGAPFFKIV